MSDPLKEFSWGELLDPIKTRVDMRDDALFPLASIRRRNGGFFHRETKLGREILTKTLSKAVSGSFAISRMQVVHGACSYVPESFGETFLSASYTQFQAKNPPRIDTKYLHYYAHSRESYSAFLKSSHGVHIEKMTFDLEDWLRQKVSLPPLPEQKKIASILTSVDDVIETTQKQIDKLQDLKKATMNELLTKGIGHTEFKDSELGRIPKSWEVRKFDDVTLDVTYGLTVRPEYQQKGVPLVSGKECRDGWIDFSIANLISQEDFSKLRKRALPKKGDIIFTKTGTLGRVALVENSYPNFAISQNVALITPDQQKVIPEFLKILSMSESVKEQTKMGASTLSVQDLQLGVLRKFLIPIPSFGEQSSIISIVYSLWSDIDIKTKKLKKYQSLKKSLMQDLLTGKVRVQVN